MGNREKNLFFSGPATKALSPTLSLVAAFLGGNLLGIFFRAANKVFFLSGQAQAPLLVAGPLKKELLFFLRLP